MWIFRTIGVLWMMCKKLLLREINVKTCFHNKRMMFVNPSHLNVFCYYNIGHFRKPITYSIKGTPIGEDEKSKTLFTGMGKKWSICPLLDEYQNIIFRNEQDTPVARICYKEKSWLYGSLVGIFCYFSCFIN